MPQQNVEPIFAMYVDDAHNDVPVPAAHAWDDERHAYPQPHTESGVAHCPPFGQRTPKLFFQSLSMPMGARMAMGRAARKIEDPSEFPRSEYETYWAPWDAKKSALSPEDYKKTLNMPAGKRMMIEREMRGIIDADMPRSEFML